MEWKNHDLVPDFSFTQVGYEKRPAKDLQGNVVDGLYNVWITFKNPKQLNSYTTQMVKETILAFRKASNERDVVAVVFTSQGDRSFCTGGNTKEYAEYYAGRPEEYRQYMRLFNDMVTSILHCDKPVICRVNGMRIAGGQEIGMACDFTITSDMAVFGQAGPRHGSAPDGGSTDFLPLFVGIERAMISCVLCEIWSAYEAYRYGLVTKVVPVLKKDGKFIPNPLVITDRWLDDMGQIVYGKKKTGADKEEAQKLLKECEVDFSLLDEEVEKTCAQLMMLFPGCTSKTIESLRKHKLAHWDKNRETNRSWLGLNMMTEARAGFRAFNEGPKGNREVDFIKLRQLLAQGVPWGDELLNEILPKKD
ncbi:MAG: 6-oxocyclohex-1-ene-1-carbonyl-CoA hydratase [Planctomycetota bacterium]|nr:MAG: 6-oxocyclohex-1-ene-1-carbonyl-CoA hydratase [Planctomycetota bacterium]